MSLARFGRAFCGVGIAIDHLKIWQAPVIEQLRPSRVPEFAPHPKQGDAVVNLGALPQPLAGFAAASPLQAPHEPGLTTRRIPELPCRSRSRCARSHSCWRRCSTDQHASRSDKPVARTHSRIRTPCVCAFAIGRRWRSECGWQSALAVVAEPPTPAARRSTQGSKRARQAIGANWMRPPIRINREPRRWRHERAAERPRQNDRWKNARQCLGKARERPAISFRLFLLPFGHNRPRTRRHVAIEAVKPSSPG